MTVPPPKTFIPIISSRNFSYFRFQFYFLPIHLKSKHESFVAISSPFTLSGVIPFNSPGFIYVDAYVVAIEVKLLVIALLRLSLVIGQVEVAGYVALGYDKHMTL